MTTVYIRFFLALCHTASYVAINPLTEGVSELFLVLRKTLRRQSTLAGVHPLSDCLVNLGGHWTAVGKNDSRRRKKKKSRRRRRKKGRRRRKRWLSTAPEVLWLLLNSSRRII